VSIYQPFDICGDAGAELNPDLYRRWGHTLGMQFESQAKFIVGGDNRSSTPVFLKALIDGLCCAGLDVVNVGQLPTPMICYARHRLNAEGCAIVTASHKPANFNGLIWMIGNRPPLSSDVQIMRLAAENALPKQSGRTRSEPRQLDVSFDYVANLQETWIDAMGSQLHIVLDPTNGCWAGKARRYLHAIFPQCLITAINDAPDASFGGRTPDCFLPENLHDLGDAVYRQRADLGIAFDGDGDCIALVDNQGMALSADETACLLMETLGHSMHNEQFVYDLRFSDRVPERAKQLGAEPLIERSGYAPIRARMSQSNALFAAETSGHYFFRALEGGDDGLYTTCRMIAFLAQSDKTLAQWRWEYPAIYITPDLQISVSADSQMQIMESIREAWSSFSQQNLDGIRIDTPGGWILIRGSATEPALSFRFESLDWSAMDHLVKQFCDKLPALGEDLWESYLCAMGTGENRL
jgi:phosphomannomutase / phosphoglucomutase